MLKRGLLTAAYLALSSLAQAGEMTLAQLIGQLQAQGVRIVYSDRHIHGEQWVSVAGPLNLESLTSALAAHGLGLHRDGELLVVVPLAQPPQPKPSATEVEPALETLIVTGSLHQLSRAGRASSLHSFSRAELNASPNAASDAVRATSRLPGLSTAGVSAKPRIRGGLQDELLVMQDGVELLEPFHLADYHSAYSSIDYRTIESLDLYTGGFPSRYGNRISGVMEIQKDWGHEDYDTDIGLSSFANFLHTRGEMGESWPSRWLISLRQGDLTELTDYVQTQAGKPRYADATARLTAVLSERLAAEAGIVYAEDDVLFRDEEEQASSQIRTHYAWAGANWALSSALQTRMTLSWLDFTRHKALQSAELDAEDPGKGGFLAHHQTVRRLALRNDWFKALSATRLEFGWQAEYSEARYRHLSHIDRGELALILGTPQVLDRQIDEAPRGWSGGAYVQAEWTPNERLTVQPSLRWDAQDYYLQAPAESQLSPRLGLSWSFDRGRLARLSLGRFYQPEGIQELQVIDGVSRFYQPQYADQLIGALEWRLSAAQITVELYYKRYRDQKGRAENIFNPFVLLPEMEPDRVLLMPEKATARGLDMDSRWHLTDNWSAVLRYSFMDARDYLAGQWVDRRWSQRHTLNAGANWARGSWQAAFALTWHSGWRTAQLPDFVPADTVIPVPAVLNNRVLPPYISLDVSLRKHWRLGASRLEVYADISNLTDRKNSAGVDYDAEPVQGGYQLVSDSENLLGLVPSVGVTLSF